MNSNDKRIYNKFSEIYEKYSNSIYRYCYWRVFSKDLAEDITQETFARFWKYLKAGKEIRQVRPFLYRIAVNLVIDSYRKNKKNIKDKRNLEEAIKSSESAAQLLYDQKKHLEDEIMFKEAFQIIKKLPKIYQDVLILRYVEDLKLKEIAEICNITIKNVSARKRRALEKVDHLINRERN